MPALRTGALTLLSILLPTLVFAQASISGVVKDSSGAVLPGVTVEASSPALIEKSRSTVTGGNGSYQIIQLQPGIYTVTFTLQGFSTYKREGLELGGNFVATVTAELKVGTLSETITVSGETPLVDVRSSSVQKVVTKEVVDAIPTGRLGINLAALQPGIILGAGGGVGQANTNSLTSQDVGGTAGDTFTDLSIHGGKAAEQRQTIGGVSAATTIRFGESLSSSPSFTAMQEMTVNTSGADASQAGGGVQMNYVPRDGGNTFRGLVYTTFANNRFQGQNYSSGVRDASGSCAPVESLFCRGLRTQPGELKETYRLQPGLWRSAYQGPALVLCHGAMDEGGELRSQRVSEHELRRWANQPDTSEHDNPDVQPRLERTVGNDVRRRRVFLGADAAPLVADQQQGQTRDLLQQQEEGIHQRHHQHLPRVAGDDVLLPVL